MREKLRPSSTPEPSSNQESAQRSLFLATALGAHCARLMSAYIDYCHAADFRSAIQPPEQIAADQFGEAVKEILCLSLLLCLNEHSELNHDMPDWFKEFIGRAIEFADRLYPAPVSKLVLRNYRLSDGVQIGCQVASMNVCHKLKLGDTTPEASLHLAQLLAEAQDARGELVEFAINQPLAELEDRIQLETT